jgi:dipeptidyl aminopeptidase/acylaminoacyl peptidase
MGKQPCKQPSIARSGTTIRYRCTPCGWNIRSRRQWIFPAPLCWHFLRPETWNWLWIWSITTILLAAPWRSRKWAGARPVLRKKGVVAADYAPDGNTLAVVRYADRKLQLEYPAGKVLFTTSGYVDHVRISPSGKQVAFLEHPVYDDDRGWVSVVDEAGNYKRLTKEYSGTRGLAWSRTGSEIWFTATLQTTDFQLYGVSLSGKVREILGRMRLMDIAADGRVLLVDEQARTEMTAIDRVTGRERRGLEWFNGTASPEISPDGKAIVFQEWSGPAGPLYLVVYRKLDGSAPVALGPGGSPAIAHRRNCELE